MTDFKKIVSFVTRLLAISVVILVWSCTSVPYQEMSDARQMVDSVEAEFAHMVSYQNGTAKDIMKKAKEQLEFARLSLEKYDYDLAREQANKAKNLAALARSEMQQKSN